MVAAAFAAFTPRRELDPWERADIADVLEAAAEWEAGRLPLAELRRIGHIEWQGQPSSGYTRFVALGAAGPRSTAGQTLLRAIEAIVEGDRAIRLTDQGAFPVEAWIDALGSWR